MSWKPKPSAADRARDRLDDEFETVAKPEGLQRTSDAKAKGRSRPAAPSEGEWQRSSEMRTSSSQRRSSRNTDPAPSPEAGDTYQRSSDARAAAANKPKKPGISLKARAVGYLSRREHGREELARKLAAYAEETDDVQAVLDGLEKDGWLSTERFAQGLVHRRASRQGTARIVQELRQHGVDDNQVAELRDQLRSTEYDRALEVWRKRFDVKPADRAAYAKQARFLASRGFAHDVIRRIVGDDDSDA